MAKVVLALGCGEGIEQGSDLSPGGFDCAFIGLSEQGLELGEDHFDGVQVRAVGLQEQKMRARTADQFAGGQTFVAAKVVGDDHIAGHQCRGKALSDPSREGIPVDRPVQHERRDDPVVAQSGKEGQRLPVPVRNMGCQSAALRGPAAGPGHVGLDPGFVNEDQSLRVKPVLMRPPPRANHETVPSGIHIPIQSDADTL